MAAIFGADWADLWSFHHESLHLPVRCACLPFVLFCFDLQSGPQALGRSWGGPSTLTKRRFTISSRTQGLGLVPCLAMFPACFC